MLWGACFVNLCFSKLCTLLCTKFWKTNIVFEPFSAFKIIKVTALPIYYFFIWIKILFVINAGIEPAFSVKFGNRTRIYIVLRESNPDCTNLREGDGRIWRKILWRFVFYLVHETFLFRESNPMNLFDDGKKFLGRQWCCVKVFLLLKNSK
jgi:hypothetical protein